MTDHLLLPQIWNSLPADLRLVDNYARFRRLLKGHYVWLRLRRLVTDIFGRRVQIYLLTFYLYESYSHKIRNITVVNRTKQLVNYINKAL